MVELLITMVILAILAAAILGTASAAMEAGRRSRTQTTINKLHGLIMERLASYETRRVDIHSDIERELNKPAYAAVRGPILADARLLATRELMKKEMPDRWEDVVYLPHVLQQSPALAQAYYRRYTDAISNASSQEEKDNIGFNESAECLFMVVMLATGDGEARTLFTNQEIDDIDDDGFSEFVDGWGNPIDWIRWPAGVVSDLQPIDIATSTRLDYDPLDVYRRDLVSGTPPKPDIGQYPAVTVNGQTFRSVYEINIRNRLLDGSLTLAQKTAFRLVPLIFSGGPDGGSAMKTSNDDMNDPNFPVLDPYVTFDGVQEGAPVVNGEFSPKDNITNHLVDY